MSQSPVDVVQRQLEAYNRRDLEGFLAVFHDQVQIFDLGTAIPAFDGKAAIRERYRALFESSPELCSVVVNRTAIGRVVIDLERVTGRMASRDVYDILAIYEVESGLIRRVHFVRP